MSKVENNAVKLINSIKINHPFKKDFIIDESTEDWDLINSERTKIEVKSTSNYKEFKKKRVRLDTPNQHKQLIFKVFLRKNFKIMEYKFIRKVEDGWIDVTKEVSK